jgi:hypothetical protein
VDSAEWRQRESWRSVGAWGETAVVPFAPAGRFISGRKSVRRPPTTPVTNQTAPPTYAIASHRVDASMPGGFVRRRNYATGGPKRAAESKVPHLLSAAAEVEK